MSYVIDNQVENTYSLVASKCGSPGTCHTIDDGSTSKSSKSDGGGSELEDHGYENVN